MSSQEALRANLIRELERLALLYVANRRARNQAPEIMVHGTVEATETYKIIGLFSKTKTSINEYDLAGWPLPNVQYRHHPDKRWWVLKDGSLCHTQRIYDLNPIGSKLTPRDVIRRRSLQELRTDDLQTIVTQLANWLDRHP